MQGSTIDVVSSRLIAGIIALRRTLGLEQGAIPGQQGQPPQTRTAPPPPSMTAAIGTVSAPRQVFGPAPVHPTIPTSSTSSPLPAVPVPASMINPGRQWIDFSQIAFSDSDVPRGTYLDIMI